MGVKRKLDEYNDGLDKSIGGQRQSILDISMLKLQAHPVRRVEPSLLRSVLILNTLKHIENELQKEGVNSDFSETASLSLNETSDVSMEVLPEAENSANEFIQQDMSDLHISSSSASSKDAANPLPPIESFVELSTAFSQSNSSVAYSSLKISTLHETSHTCKEQISLEHQQPNFPVKAEDILGDIDISHCDFDIFSSLASSMKLTPLSAEEVMHSFPGHNTVDSYPSLFSNTVSSTCKSDLLPEEIDGIMQILVGT